MFVFTSDAIQTNPSIQLTCRGLILMGLLGGGDYDSTGIFNCGLKSAHGLAKCGFGESLFKAACALSRSELILFLGTWRDEL